MNANSSIMSNISTATGLRASRNISNDLESDMSGSAHTRDLVVLTILGVMIALINGLILVSFLMCPHLRKRPANMMICSQACTDLFTGLVYIPVYLAKSEMVNFLNIYMLYLSLFNLAIISLDRYLAMNRPFLHRRFIYGNRTRRMIVGVWICPLGLTLIPLSFLHEREKNVVVFIRAMKIYISIVWLLMLVLVVSMSVLYIHASKGAKRTIKSRRTSFQNSQVKARAQILARKELRVVHLFGLLLFFFVGAYLPILYINFCEIIDRPEYAPQVMLPISLYLLITNSVLNPILCILLKKDFLYAIKMIFLRCYGCTDQMSNTSKLESDYELSTTGTPVFNRKGTFRKSQADYDKQRHRMVSEQLDYSSGSPFLKKMSVGNGRKCTPYVQNNSFPNRITKQGSLQKIYSPEAQACKEKRGAVGNDVRMEIITERNECDYDENI